MNARQHADLEALSAYVDGEAPEWADHVASCAACRASADELRAVAAAVGVPVDAPDPALRERAVAAALGDVDQRHVAEDARSRHRRFQRRLNVAAIAAVLVAAVGFTTILYTSRTGRDDATTVAGPAPESALSDNSAAASLPPTDLGEVPDAATLRAWALPAVAGSLAATSDPGETPSTALGSASGGAGGAATNPGSTPLGGQRSAAPSPTVVGTRPCEEQARAREPGLRQVVYFATARRGGVPAVVLGFSTGPAPAQVTFLMLAQDGCAELLRVVEP